MEIVKGIISISLLLISLGFMLYCFISIVKSEKRSKELDNLLKQRMEKEISFIDKQLNEIVKENKKAKK